MNHLKQLPHSVSTAFLTACLLGAGDADAERIVLAAMEMLSPEAVLHDSFALTVAELTLGRMRHPCEVRGAANTCGRMALELRRVAALPAALRNCVVLRILLGCSESVCSRLLGADDDTVAFLTVAGLEKLAATAEMPLQHSAVADGK